MRKIVDVPEQAHVQTFLLAGWLAVFPASKEKRLDMSLLDLGQRSIPYGGLQASSDVFSKAWWLEQDETVVRVVCPG